MKRERSFTHDVPKQAEGEDEMEMDLYSRGVNSHQSSVACSDHMHLNQPLSLQIS